MHRSRWKAKMEQDLRRKLAQKIAQEKKSSDEPTPPPELASAGRNRPKSQREIKETLALYAAATALAVSQGRIDPSFPDLRECSGVPRLVC